MSEILTVNHEKSLTNLDTPHSETDVFHQTNSPNGELILQFLRLENPGEESAGLAKYSASDWEVLYGQAERFGLTPFLAWRLNEHPEISPPEEICAKFRKSLLVSTARSVRMIHELGNVLHRFNQEGIPVILLKGAHLASFVYPSIGTRPMGDVDLLVHPEDLQHTTKIMLDLGYQSSAGMLDANKMTSVHHHLPGFLKSDSLSLEIHWSIVHPKGPFQIALNDLWAEAVEANLNENLALVLSPQHLFIHLCLHAYANRFHHGLRALVDLSQVMRHHHEAVRWEQLKETAQRWRAAKCVYLSLYLSRQLLKAPSERILEIFETQDLNPQLIQHLSSNIFEDSHPSVNYIQLWGNLGFSQKVSLFWKRIFLPPEKMTYLYKISPNSLWLIWFYIIRLKELVLRYGRSSWQNLYHNELSSSADLETMLEEWITTDQPTFQQLNTLSK